MNVSIRLVAVRVLLAGLVLFLGACNGEEETAPMTETPAPSIPIPEPQTAYLASVGGEVQFPTALAELDVGDVLADNLIIEISANSFVDIQFGDRAVARVSGPGSVFVNMRGGVPERPIYELVLQAGSAAVDVSFLAPGEVFRVRTPAAMYRVTGTRFAVSTGEEDEVAVSEGSVEVLPPSLDLDRFLESDAATDETVRDALFGMLDSLPTVTAGNSGRVEPDRMAESDKLAEQLADKLRQVEAATGEDRPNLVTELLSIIRQTSRSLDGTVVLRTGAAADLAEKMAQLDEMSMLPVPKDPQGLSLLESEELSNLVKFTLRTVPQNSDIYVNDLWVGQSVYRAVLHASDSLSIRVTKEGYRERRLQVDRARSEVVTVQLERLPPSISAESFIKAIRADDLGTVRTYVREGGSVDVQTSDRMPAVVLASGLVPVLRGQVPDLSYHREILQTVVAADANLEVPFDIEGSTFKLLHAAVLAGVAGFDVIDILTLFTEAGAEINGTIVLEGEELTPLAVAVRWALFTGVAQEELLKILVEAGSDLDVAISYNDEILTLREIAGRLVQDGDVADPELIQLLQSAERS